MGQIMSFIGDRFSGRKTFKILMFGTVGTGKTTILYRYFLGKTVLPRATMDMITEKVEFNDVFFEICKPPPCMGHFFNLYENIAPKSQGVVFVFDSANRDRWSRGMEHIDIVADQLGTCIYHNGWTEDVVLLIFANRQDLPGAKTVEEIVDKLRLRSYPGLNWHVQASVATKGIGLREGFDWMYNELVKKECV